MNELLQAGTAIKKIYAVEAWVQQCNNFNNLSIITAGELAKISNLQTPNQVLAIAGQPLLPRETGLKNNLTLVLDGIQDPGNLGTIIRIADWFGIYQVIASEDSADKYNPKVVQASMGSLLRVNVWYKNLGKWLAGCPVKVFGALLNGDNVFTTTKIKEGVLVIGNESKGIRPEVLPFVQQALTIPGKGSAESLNAAVATGIILSHVAP
ncbi:MAG TPA: RNA methyltransferase [Chitinophagaceae bacterium]|nr:RNA methyltransferase [Chitinophagaceae bacterium]